MKDASQTQMEAERPMVDFLKLKKMRVANWNVRTLYQLERAYLVPAGTCVPCTSWNVRTLYQLERAYLVPAGTCVPCTSWNVRTLYQQAGSGGEGVQ